MTRNTQQSNQHTYQPGEKYPVKRKSVISVGKKTPTPDLYGELYRASAKLTEYSYAVSQKFPKREKERVSLGNDIRTKVIGICEQIIELCCFNPLITAIEREEKLRHITVELKTVNVMIKIAYKHRYMSPKVLTKWVRLVRELDNLVIGLAIWYQRERERVEREASRANAATGVEIK